MFYEDVFRELNKQKVKYVVAGGVAVVLHGVVRLTVDLDLYVKLSENNLRKFVGALGSLGYKPKVPVNAIEFVKESNRKIWKKEKGMKVFSFIHLGKPRELIDVFVDELIKYSEVDREKKVMMANGIKIPVISIKHLKELKQMAGREQDLRDIQALDSVEKLREAKG